MKTTLFGLLLTLAALSLAACKDDAPKTIKPAADTKKEEAKPPMPPARPVEIAELRLTAIPDRDHADCEALVGKGTYIRALARDLGAGLGTLAHIAELRRLSVGRFTERQAIALDSLAERGHIATDCGFLLPIETGLDDIPAFVLTGGEAARLRSGRTECTQAA